MKHGFTLLELSIVLVIIGLIIGGITAGADLIRGAELNSVISDVNKYKVAINTFKLKYNALPGDMNNAESYWGTAHATNATCRTTDLGTEATCNGDGDERIDLSITTRSTEGFRFWQHLVNSGIISGSYTGVPGALSQYDHIIGENIPESSISGAGFYASHRADATGWGHYFNVNHGNHLMLGADTTGGTGALYDGVVTPAEAKQIDSKIDDSMPATGQVISKYFPPCTLASSGNDLTGDYRLSETSTACFLTFSLD